MAYTHLKQGGSSFSEMMLQNGFGIVTVMNAQFYDYNDIAKDYSFKDHTVEEVVTHLLSETPICRLDTLKVANVTVEGPTKTITGGQYSNPLIKFGKTARLEMQDALGNSRALEALCGGLNEWDAPTSGSELSDNDYPVTGLRAFHYGEDFSEAKVILGDSFFIDKKSGKQIKVKILFYQFMPDSLFNLTQDAEGDATVFDMNGDLLITDVKTFDNKGAELTHGMFYSVLAEVAETPELLKFNSEADVNAAGGQLKVGQHILLKNGEDSYDEKVIISIVLNDGAYTVTLAE